MRPRTREARRRAANPHGHWLSAHHPRGRRAPANQRRPMQECCKVSELLPKCCRTFAWFSSTWSGAGIQCTRLRLCEATLTRARLTRFDSEPPHGSSPPAGAVHFGTVQSPLPRRKRRAPERGPSGAFAPIGANVLRSWSTPPYRAQRARPARDRRRC